MKASLTGLAVYGGFLERQVLCFLPLSALMPLVQRLRKQRTRSARCQSVYWVPLLSVRYYTCCLLTCLRDWSIPNFSEIQAEEVRHRLLQLYRRPCLGTNG